MIYLLWALPTLIVIAAIASGRANTSVAACLGLACAAPVAWMTGPAAIGLEGLGHALARGLWIGATITPYILGGLLFWQVASRPSSDNAASAPPPPPGTDLARRRLVFFACFLVGPFAESATGFGVGMLGTSMLIRPLGIKPRHLMVFALLSQTLIPWGAMSSGTMLASAYARIPPSELALYALAPVALLMMVWLALFWRTAHLAGLRASTVECVREAVWVVCGLSALALTTAAIGPEAALLAAYGPLIVIRYLADYRPDARQARLALRRALPYALLVGGLAITRLVPEIRQALTDAGQVVMARDLNTWSPLFHAGSWLIVGSLITAAARGQWRDLGQEARAAWRTGRHAVYTVFLFAMMAEVLTAGGISGAFAVATFATLGQYSILLTPLLSGALGILTNSGNPGNSLLLPSQIALAMQAGLSVPAVTALQHASGMSMGLFSPVRMAIAAQVAQGNGLQRRVYADLLPYAGCALALLMGMAVWILMG